MSLLLQVLGGLVAATIIAVVVAERPSRAVAARAIGATAIVVLAVAALASLWPTAKGQWDAHSVERKLSPEERAQRGATVAGINTAFVEWLATKIGRHESFALATNNTTAQQWISYRLMPRWMADSPEHADWVIFYGASPRDAGLPESDLTDVRTFQPTFSIARLRREAQ